MGDLLFGQGASGFLIGHGEQNVYAGNAVRDAVVNSEKKDAAVTVIFDQMNLPKRFVQVQGGNRQIGDHRLQFGFIARCRKGDTLQVRSEVKVFVIFPTGDPNA